MAAIRALLNGALFPQLVPLRYLSYAFVVSMIAWMLASDSWADFPIGDPEGGPPGYTIVYLCGDDLAVAFRTMEDRGPLVLITSPRDAPLCTGPEHVVCGSGVLRARIWSNEPVVEVCARIDDARPFALRAIGPQDWASPLPAANLSKGVHRLNVKAMDDVGGASERLSEFALDPTGRYTAIPRVHPFVAATNFC